MSEILMDADVAAEYGTRVRITSHGYVRVGMEYLHRLVMGVSGCRVVVDHINRNKLDCRRANLRVTTQTGNARNSKFRSHNTSGYRGVYWCTWTRRWRAEIRVQGKGVKLGRFGDKIDAAKAYDEAARRLHGEFAQVNFP